MTVVAAAVAGDDLESVARAAAEGLGCPVAIALPSFGPVAHWPAARAGGFGRDVLAAIGEHANAVIEGRRPRSRPGIAHAVAVRIGREVVGAAVALAPMNSDPTPGGDALDAWLSAAAAGAAVTALMHDSSGVDVTEARRAFLRSLELQAPADVEAMLAHARRLGAELEGGAIAICTLSGDGGEEPPEPIPGLIAAVGEERTLGLLPLDGAEAQLELLRSGGARVAASAPQSDPAALHDALREAGVVLELLIEPKAMLVAHEQTYRLLIGVLLHDPDQLARLREATIAALERYDADHDTDLVATLEAFLAHHGSTTETADAMSLHRHTVGYRLARVQEVSGLSPYESDGRERLSLGLKAQRILEADARRGARARAA